VGADWAGERARAAHARLFAARERAQAAIYRSCAALPYERQRLPLTEIGRDH
jgi:hypothetical protein